jgi:transposase-like protein
LSEKNKLSESDVAEMVRLRRQGWSMRDIARKFKVNHTTVLHWVRKNDVSGGARGSDASGEAPPPQEPGVVQDKTDVDGTIDMLKMDRPPTVKELMDLCDLERGMWVPEYMKVNTWQGFGKLKGAAGERFEKVQLYQSKLTVKRVVAAELYEGILEFVRKNVGALPKPEGKPKENTVGRGFMVAWGLWDCHVGSYSWNSETNNDWDVDTACRRIFNSIDDMVEELRPYPVEQILMPVGNDLLHFDSARMKTAFGEHYLDTDTRYARVWQAGLACLAYMVERALEITDSLVIPYVPGNHDLTSSFTLTAALAQRYRNDPRVVFDLRANPRKYFTHGGVLLGFDHGADIKPDRMAMIMSTEAQAQWGASTYREMQIGHTHQRRERQYDGLIPVNGLLVRTNPSLCSIDQWHHSKGMIGEPMKSVEAYRYDRIGFRGSHVTWARDLEHPKAREALKAIK